jgi:hypothetical protein
MKIPMESPRTEIGAITEGYLEEAKLEEQPTPLHDQIKDFRCTGIKTFSGKVGKSGKRNRWTGITTPDVKAKKSLCREKSFF